MGCCKYKISEYTFISRKVLQSDFIKLFCMTHTLFFSSLAFKLVFQSHT